MKRLFYLISIAFFISCTASKNSRNSKNEIVFVKIETDSGTMVARLYNQTPLHKENFEKLVKKHFYDGLLFHRVIKGFMIQGGDPESRNAKPGQHLGDGGSKKMIPAEFDTSLFHRKGALAMAREGDDVNPKKESSSSQFYIVEGKTFTNLEMSRIEEQFRIKIPEDHKEVYRTVGGAPFLDMNYTVFGQVVKGLDVIDKIAHAPKDKNDRPLQDIKMKIILMKKSEYKKYL
ncbi:MAG: peptidylprolyl isomerase [Ginsengibacter sp.]